MARAAALLSLFLVNSSVLGDVGEPVVGTVERTESRWIGGRIVTRALLRGSDGSESSAEMLGGSVGGIGMRVVGGPELQVGEHVALWLDDGWVRLKSVLSSQRRDYVRALADSTRAPLSWWDSNCVTVIPNAAGAADLPFEDVLEILRRAASSWQTATSSCGHMQIIIGEPRKGLSAEHSLEGPHENVVIWLDDFWGQIEEGVPYPTGVLALTTLFYLDQPGAPDNGRIVDGDIELNGVDWSFDRGECKSPVSVDTESTLTHEFGHLLGLAHSCASAFEEPGLDHENNPAPFCSDAPADVLMTTMVATTDPCSPDLRSPEADDVLGICSIYPLKADPGICREPAPIVLSDFVEGGCSLSSSLSSSLSWRSMNHVGGGALTALLVLCSSALICRIGRRRGQGRRNGLHTGQGRARAQSSERRRRDSSR